MRFATLFLFAFFVVGCAQRDGPLRPFVGRWRCDDETSFSYWLQQAKDAEEREHWQREIGLQKALTAKLGHTMHSDIHVMPRRIEGYGRILKPSYDVLKSENKEGIIHARVLRHEEMKDPGDADELSMRTYMVGDCLALHFRSDGGEFEVTYLFTRL